MKRLFNLKVLMSNVVIIIITCSIFSLLIYNFTSRALISNAKESLIEVSKQGSKNVRAELKGNLEVLETVAKSYPINNSTIDISVKLKALKQEVKFDKLKRINIINAKGIAKSTDGKTVYVGNRLYFKKAMTGEEFISDPLTSKFDKSMVIVFAEPIYSNNKVIGVLSMANDVAFLSEITDNIKLGNNDASFIINSKGTIIANQDLKLVYNKTNYIHNAKLKQLSRLEVNMIKGESGAGEYEYNNVDRFMGYSPIMDTSWSIGVTAPKSQIFKITNSILKNIIIIMLLVSFIIIILNFYLNYLKRNLMKETRLLNNAVDAAVLLIISINIDGTILDFNYYAEQKSGLSKKKVINSKSIYDIVPHKYWETINNLLDNISLGRDVDRVEFPIINSLGTNSYILWSIKNNTDMFALKDCIEIIGVDITDRKENELKIIELAYFDTLTGLPNRTHSAELVNNYLSSNPSSAALIYIDLDDFKLINDTFGHSIGDKLLLKVAEQLNLVGDKNTISRLGGDEFSLFIKEEMNNDSIKEKLSFILKMLNIDYTIDGIRLNISGSIGVSIYPENGTSFEELLKNADTAMYKAKSEGKNNYVVFDKIMNSNLLNRMHVGSDLRRAIENKEFLLHYQPQVDTKTGKICGYEALIRWKHPVKGLIYPNDFIRFAEDDGLIIDIGEFVIKESINFLKKLEQMGENGINISVNVSVLQLKKDSFYEYVERIIKDNQIEPLKFGIEITETILFEFIDTNIEKLMHLREIGVDIILDDFGKGYSSLSYLQQLPFSILKVDKSFTDVIGKKDDITKSIIEIAHKLGLKVVAEGVEQRFQYENLLRSSCDFIQGYYVSKPVEEKEALKLLDEEYFSEII